MRASILVFAAIVAWAFLLLGFSASRDTGRLGNPGTVGALMAVGAVAALATIGAVRKLRDGANPPAPASRPTAVAASPAKLSPEEQAAIVNFKQRLVANTPLIYVAPLLLLANIGLFIVMALCGAGFFFPTSAALVGWGADYAPLTLHGEWWRLLTSMFVHVGVIHLLMNMVALAKIGPVAERIFGQAPFVLIYVGSGLIGGFVSEGVEPDVVSAGASGAIFGLFGALYGFALRREAGVPATTLKAIKTQFGTFFVANLLFAFQVPNINLAAHIGGAAGGVVLGFVTARPLDAEAWRRALMPVASLATACVALCVWPLAKFASARERTVATPSSAGPTKAFSTRGLANARGVDLSLAYPADWPLRTRSSDPHVIARLSQPAGLATLQVVVMILPEKIPAAGVPDWLVSQPLPSGAKFIHSRVTSPDTIPGSEIAWSSRDRKGTRRILMRLFVSRDSIASVATAVSIDTKYESLLDRHFEAYRPIFAQILDSIRIDGKSASFGPPNNSPPASLNRSVRNGPGDRLHPASAISAIAPTGSVQTPSHWLALPTPLALPSPPPAPVIGSLPTQLNLK